MIDPGTEVSTGIPKDAAEVFRRALASRVLLFDNLQTLPAWFQDELCKLSTGYEGTRYNVKYSFCRAVLVNGLTPSVTRSDFTAQTVLVTLPPFERRRADSGLMQEFEARRPLLQAALFRVIGYGLARFEELAEQYATTGRLSAWEAWLEACETGIAGIAPGTFARLLAQSQVEAPKAMIEASPDARALVTLLGECDGRTWSGTGTELVTALAGVAARHPELGTPSDAPTTLIRGLKRREAELATVYGLEWESRRANERLHTFRLTA